MPVRETAAIRIISTTAGVVTFWVLRKMLSLPASRVICNDEDACTVYINLMATGQPSCNSLLRGCVPSVPILTTPAIAMTLSIAA